MPDPIRGAPWYGRTFVAMLILMLLIAVAVRWRLDPVAPLGSDAAVGEFSAARAAKALSTVLGDEQPHPVDSHGADGVRQRIVSELEGLGYQVDVQDTTSCRKYRYSTCARVRNLVAVHEGTSQGQAMLLSAHYDSVAAGPGASDAGTAVGALLEVARLLKGREAGKNSVILLFNEGEEAGLLGAEAFIAQHPLAKDVSVAINIEARGTSGQSVMFETGDNSGWLVKAFSSTSKRPLTNSLLYEAYKLMPNDTDLTVFKANGIQGLNFAQGEQLPYYHTPKDNLEHLNLGSLQQHGDNAYGLVDALLDADLTAGNEKGNRVYTDILGATVIHWPVSWGVGIAGVLIVVFAFAGWRLRKRYHYRLGSVIGGFLSFPIALAVGGTVAYALTYLLSFVNGGATPWHSNALFNRLLLWGAVLLAVIVVQRLLSRRADVVGFWIGVSLPWLLMAVVASIWLPGTSYLFVLPSAALVVAALVLQPIARRAGDNALPALFATPAAVAFLALIPTVYLIEIMLGFNATAGVIGMGAILGLAATFIGPLTSPGPETRAHNYTYYALLLLVAGGAFASVLAPAYTETQPQPLNITYLQDSGGKAHVLVGTQYQAPPLPVLQEMGEAVSLVAKLPWTGTRQYVASAGSIGLPAGNLAVVSEKAVAGGREVTAQINAGPSSHKFMIMIPRLAGLSAVEMDGRIVDYAAGDPLLQEHFVFVCQGESCDGKQIKVTLTSKGPQPALLARVTAGVPEQFNAIARSRDLQALPYGDGDQSVVLSAIHL